MESTSIVWRARHNPWVIALTVTLATGMELLDYSIVNVSVPHIASSLGSTQRQTAWVIAIYFFGASVVVPLSAWLSRALGRKTYYMWSVALFLVASLLCGLAPNINVLIVCRGIQGLSGGGLVATERAILADTFPGNKRGMAFAAYGTVIALAPTIAPWFGGWLTEAFNWRWIFLINVPVGLLSLVLTARFVEDPPYIALDKIEARRSGVDVPGICLVAFSTICLQFGLIQGPEMDWFHSDVVGVSFLLAAISLVAWICWERLHSDPMLDVRLLKSPVFAFTMVATFAVSGLSITGSVLLSRFLQTTLHYPAIEAGEVLVAGGLAVAIMMPVVGGLLKKGISEVLLFLGLVFAALAFYLTSTHLSGSESFSTLITIRIGLVIGIPFMIVPLSILAFSSIPGNKNNQVSTFFAWVDNLGSSIGLALMDLFLLDRVQVHQEHLAGHLAAGGMQVQRFLHGWAGSVPSVGSTSLTAGALTGLQQAVHDAAGVLAFVDAFAMMALVIVLMLPIPFVIGAFRRQLRVKAQEHTPV